MHKIRTSYNTEITVAFLKSRSSTHYIYVSLIIGKTFIFLLISVEHIKLFQTILSKFDDYHDQLLLKRHIHCHSVITGTLLLPSSRTTAKFKTFQPRIVTTYLRQKIRTRRKISSGWK